jgi:hypothetical protein
VLVLLLINSCTPTFDQPSNVTKTDTNQTAVADLPQGWTQDVLYSNVCASPINMTAKSDGSMLINDRCDSRVLELLPDGDISEWANTGDVGMDTIVYQAQQMRLLGVSGSKVFVIEPGSLTDLGTFKNNEQPVALVSDPRNDHLYGVELGENKAIKEYDQDLNLIREIHQVSNCQNIALDPERDLLYFTESITGTVNSIDLRSGEVKNITSGLGEGFVDINIGVAVGDQGELYYSTLTDGLFRVTNTASGDPQIQKLMDVPFGVGSIYWWSAGKSILQTNVFAGTIVKFDVAKNNVELLEPNVNTTAIAMDSSGVVYFYSQQQLYRLDNGKIESLGSKLDTSVFSIAFDNHDNLYVPIDRFLRKIDVKNGMLENYIEFDDGNIIKNVLYDGKHDEYVALADYDQLKNGIAIWRVANQADARPRLVATIELDNPSDSFMAINRNTGSIYFYNQDWNAIFEVDEASSNLKLLISDIIEPGEMPLNGFSFFTPLNGFIITVLAEGRFFLPLDGGPMERFSSMACGMDNVQGIEDAHGDYLATQSGKIYLIRKCRSGEKCQ